MRPILHQLESLERLEPGPGIPARCILALRSDLRRLCTWAEAHAELRDPLLIIQWHMDVRVTLIRHLDLFQRSLRLSPDDGVLVRYRLAFAEISARIDQQAASVWKAARREAVLDDVIDLPEPQPVA